MSRTPRRPETRVSFNNDAAAQATHLVDVFAQRRRRQVQEIDRKLKLFAQQTKQREQTVQALLEKVAPDLLVQCQRERQAILSNPANARQVQTQLAELAARYEQPFTRAIIESGQDLTKIYTTLDNAASIPEGAYQMASPTDIAGFFLNGTTNIVTIRNNWFGTDWSIRADPNDELSTDPQIDVVHTPPYAFSRQITGVADANLAQIRVRHDYLLIPPLPFISDPLGGGAASLGIAVEFAGTGSQVQLIAEVAVTNADASGYISSGVASTLADIVFAGSTEDEMLFETAATVATHNVTSGLVGTAFDTPPLDEVPTYYTLYWEMTTQADTLLRLFVGGYASTGVLGVGWTSCNLEFTVTKFVVRFLSP